MADVVNEIRGEIVEEDKLDCCRLVPEISTVLCSTLGTADVTLRESVP